jgi:hypothetical protein
MAAHKAAFPPPMTMTSNSSSVEMEVEIGVAPEWYWQTSPFAGPPLESFCYELRSRIANAPIAPETEPLETRKLN